MSALLCSLGWQLYPLCLMLPLLSSMGTDNQNIAPASAQHLGRPGAVLGSVECIWKHLAGLCEIICKTIQHPVRWLGFAYLSMPLCKQQSHGACVIYLHHKPAALKVRWFQCVTPCSAGAHIPDTVQAQTATRSDTKVWILMQLSILHVIHRPDFPDFAVSGSSQSPHF